MYQQQSQPPSALARALSHVNNPCPRHRLQPMARGAHGMWHCPMCEMEERQATHPRRKMVTGSLSPLRAGRLAHEHVQITSYSEYMRLRTGAIPQLPGPRLAPSPGRLVYVPGRPRWVSELVEKGTPIDDTWLNSQGAEPLEHAELGLTEEDCVVDLEGVEDDEKTRESYILKLLHS